MAKTYDLKNVICTVGGIGISGFGETDAIDIEWSADIVEPKVTADGTYVYSRLNDRGCMVTLTLSQKSRAYLLLSGVIEVQHGDNLGIAPPLIVPTPFFLLDPATGDTITSGECVFLSRPAPSKGKLVGDIQFKLHLPSPKVIYGAANVI